jgi:hypothetical protein
MVIRMKMDGSVDTMEESSRKIQVDNPRNEQCKGEGDALNCRFSDDGNLDNLTSCNNDVRGGDTVILTDRKDRDTVDVDTATAERISNRERGSSNSSSIRALGVTRYDVKAGRGTVTKGLDDDKNGGTADGTKSCGVVERRDNSTKRTATKGLDVNDGEKDTDEEGHNEGKLEYEFSGALPDMNERRDRNYDSLAQRGRTEED